MRFLLPAGLGLLWAVAANAQFGRGGGEWMTAGGDAQRSSWIRTDEKISADSLRKGGFEFLWKAKLPADANGVSEAVLLDRYIGYRGFRSLAFVGGANGNVAAVDTDLDRIEWQRRIPLAAGISPQCGGSALTLVARPTSTDFPTAGAAFGGLGGRGGPAKSAVGEPYQGAVTLSQASATGRGAGFPGRGMFRRIPAQLWALTPDGMLHAMYVSNGQEPEAPKKFLPPGAAARGFIVIQKVGDNAIENIAYAVTDDGCGAPSAVWALDAQTGNVSSWKSAAPIAGDAGLAIAPDGTVYVASGSSITALEPKTLAVKDSYSASAPFVTSPVLLQLGKKTLIAAEARDGNLHLLDAASIKAPVATASGRVPGEHAALASWQDRSGTRWIAAPAGNAVMAMKVADRNGTPAIETAWTSPEIGPAPAISIINDVVFVAAHGNPGVVYALDSLTGKPVWNSGKTIPSRVNGAVSGGGGQIYVAGRDGMLYAFGFPMEH